MNEQVTMGYVQYKRTFHPPLKNDVVSELAALFSTDRREVFRRAALAIGRCVSDAYTDYDAYAQKGGGNEEIPDYVEIFFKSQGEGSLCSGTNCMTIIRGVRHYTRSLANGSISYYCSPTCMGLMLEGGITTRR